MSPRSKYISGRCTRVSFTRFYIRSIENLQLQEPYFISLSSSERNLVHLPEIYLDLGDIYFGNHLSVLLPPNNKVNDSENVCCWINWILTDYVINCKYSSTASNSGLCNCIGLRFNHWRWEKLPIPDPVPPPKEQVIIRPHFRGLNIAKLF